MRIKIRCLNCANVTELKHTHQLAQSIFGTHMIGSEVFECLACGHKTLCTDDNANRYPFRFDKPKHKPHNWIPSTLGHGETMCSRCHVTNREAAVLGTLNKCEL